MNWNDWIRQTHRCLSIAFTVAAVASIIVNIAGLQGRLPSGWDSRRCPSAHLAASSRACTCSLCRMLPVGAAGDAPQKRSMFRVTVVCEEFQRRRRIRRSKRHQREFAEHRKHHKSDCLRSSTRWS